MCWNTDYYKDLYNTWTLMRPVMGLEHLGPYHQMPNHYLNDFGKLLRFRSVQLLRKQFMNENKSRWVRKKGA